MRWVSQLIFHWPTAFASKPAPTFGSHYIRSLSWCFATLGFSLLLQVQLQLRVNSQLPCQFIQIFALRILLVVHQ